MTATLETKPTAPPDLDRIRDYLIANPAFIREDAELFALLAQSEPQDGIIDLGAAAREKLLTEIRQLRALNAGIVETARANLAVQSQVHMAVLALLEAESLSALDRKFAGRVPGALGVDICRCFIEGHAPLASAEAILGASDGLTADVLGERVERLGPVGKSYATAVYGPQGQRVRSEALVRLDFNGREGFLAVAARDPNLFTPGQGTELLNFLARTLERLIVSWMNRTAS